MLKLNLKTQILDWDAGKHSYWREVVEAADWEVAKAAILLCDVWDKHWCRGATERVDEMVPRMDEVVKAARGAGVQIVHAPSGTMEFYAETAGRKRVLEAPQIEPPDELEREDPPQPVDSSDGGSDTGEEESFKAWHRQHPGIEIDQESDLISDDGREVYNCMAQRGIDNLLIMGVHTNMCVLNRSFAIKQMVRWGKQVALIGDLTDAMYNPARAPYVGHAEGTRLIIEYIEKFWCPTVSSEQILQSCR